jgi:flavin-dependent dehydrogenase
VAGALAVDVLVVGGGPAGSTLATRLAQLGHDVALIEREEFPRARLGESLTPGVLPLLRVSGADASVEQAGFTPITSVLVDWAEGPRVRRDDGGQGLAVDRGRFDSLLLDHARANGVRVLQPAAVTDRRHDGDRWSLRVQGGGDMRASYLAIAAGRSGVLRGRRSSTGPRTLCLYAYWRGAELSGPCIQALPDGWCWGVPLPDGTANLLVFVEPERLRAEGRDVADCYERLLGCSELALFASRAERVTPVRGADATPYLERACVTKSAIRVGDAGLALDPISSSGVQKAVQTALSGAIVVNTILRRPDAADAARRFYASNLERASDRHRLWAAAHYASAAVTRPGSFWARRATAPGLAPATPLAEPAALDPSVGLAVSHAVEFLELPCVVGTFVETRTAVSHPLLDEPVAFLGGWELAPLLHLAPKGSTASDLVRAWSGHVPLDAGRAICDWLGRSGILVPVGERP